MEFNRDLNISQKRILIVAEGDTWAGIESHLLYLLSELKNNKNLSLTVLLFYKEEFYKWLIKNKIETKVIYKRNLLKSFKEIIILLKKNRFNIIHTHSTSAGFYIAIIFFLYRNCQWISTQHSKPEKIRGKKKLKSRFTSNIVYIALRIFKSVRIICVTKDISDWLHYKKKISREKLIVIYNGINLKLHISNEKHTAGTRKKKRRDYRAVVIGRLDPVKGHKYVIEAINLLRNEDIEIFKKIKIYFIGEGIERARLTHLVSKYKLEKHIHFTGYMKNAFEFVRYCDAVIIPSIHEGLPYSLLEAMALGKIIIATSVGGLKEVLFHKENSLLIPAKEPTAIKNAIKVSIKDKELCDKIQRNAKKIVKIVLSSEMMAKKTKDTYFR